MMSVDRAKMVVVYEDSRPPSESFGLHDLVLACAADELEPGSGRWPIRELVRLTRCVPKNGNSKVRRFLETQVEALARGRPVLVVVDADKIRALFPEATSNEQARVGLELLNQSCRIAVRLLER